MTITERDELYTKLIEEAHSLMKAKGADYAGDADVLYNFKSGGERAGITTYQYWLTQFAKQEMAIENAVKASPTNPQAGMKSEPLRSRVIDVINYAVLLLCIEKDLQ